jgi:hypothetical protein
MAAMNRQIADALPAGRHVVLESREPIITPDDLAPAVAAFILDAAGAET